MTIHGPGQTFRKHVEQAAAAESARLCVSPAWFVALSMNALQGTARGSASRKIGVARSVSTGPPPSCRASPSSFFRVLRILRPVDLRFPSTKRAQCSPRVASLGAVTRASNLHRVPASRRQLWCRRGAARAAILNRRAPPDFLPSNVLDPPPPHKSVTRAALGPPGHLSISAPLEGASLSPRFSRCFRSRAGRSGSVAHECPKTMPHRAQGGSSVASGPRVLLTSTPIEHRGRTVAVTYEITRRASPPFCAARVSRKRAPNSQQDIEERPPSAELQFEPLELPPESSASFCRLVICLLGALAGFWAAVSRSPNPIPRLLNGGRNHRMQRPAPSPVGFRQGASPLDFAPRVFAAQSA